MKKTILVLLLATTLGCASDYNRIKDCEQKFPGCKCSPPSKMIQDNGIDVMMEDTLGNIYGLNYYMGSETKIYSMRIIK